MILLAHPYFLRDDAKQLARMKPYPPLATLLAAAVLREQGHDVTLFDAILADGLDDFRAALTAARPTTVAIVEDSFNYIRKMCMVRLRTLCPGEVVVQIARGDTSAALRRRSRGAVPARLGGREFDVRYHSAGELADAMGPWFRLKRRIGVGVLVPPSAAEPWISRHPALVRTLERMDRVLARPFAPLGDHVLYWLERMDVPCHGAARVVAPQMGI